MIRFNPLNLLFFVRTLWNSFFIRANDIAEATATPVEAGMNLKEAVLSLQAQINALEPPTEPEEEV